jgi:hypothetical protein
MVLGEKMHTQVAKRPSRQPNLRHRAAAIPASPPDQPRSASLPSPQPLLTTVKGGRAMMGGIGNTTIWALIGTGELRTVKFGRRRMIEIRSIHEVIAKRRVRREGG